MDSDSKQLLDVISHFTSIFTNLSSSIETLRTAVQEVDRQLENIPNVNAFEKANEKLLEKLFEKVNKDKEDYLKNHEQIKSDIKEIQGAIHNLDSLIELIKDINIAKFDGTVKEVEVIGKVHEQKLKNEESLSKRKWELFAKIILPLAGTIAVIFAAFGSKLIQLIKFW